MKSDIVRVERAIVDVSAEIEHLREALRELERAHGESEVAQSLRKFNSECLRRNEEDTLREVIRMEREVGLHRKSVLAVETEVGSMEGEVSCACRFGDNRSNMNVVFGR